MDKDLELAVQKIRSTYDTLELSRVIGEPVDPRRPYPEILDKMAFVDIVSSREYYYYFSTSSMTDKIYTTLSSGITQSNVTPGTPTLAAFIDLTTPELWIKLTDLATSKEAVLARTKKGITRSLDIYEIYKVIDLINTSCVANGNVESLTSGEKRFTYENFVDTLDNVIEYGNNFTFLTSGLVDKDITLFDWYENKNIAIRPQFKELGVETIRIPVAGTFNLDDVSTSAITNGNAYLIAKQSESSVDEAAVLWARKEIEELNFFGTPLYDTDKKPQRLVFFSANPVTNGSTRHLGVAATGYMNVFGAVLNSKAVWKFQRS